MFDLQIEASIPLDRLRFVRLVIFLLRGYLFPVKLVLTALNCYLQRSLLFDGRRPKRFPRKQRRRT